MEKKKKKKKIVLMEKLKSKSFVGNSKSTVLEISHYKLISLSSEISLKNKRN